MRSFSRIWMPTVLILGGLLAHPTAFAADPAAQPAGPPPAAAAPPRVRVTTSMGEFTLELIPDRAPLTVMNFVRYVKEGFYSGTVIHRVIANFVIQGGGHEAGDYKLKPTHEPIFNESGSGLQNKRGTVGLARSAQPYSGNSQFYINLVDNPDLDPLPTRWGYAVFGRVVEGMDVVDRIGVAPTGAAGPFKADAPITPVIIQKVALLDSSTPAPPSPPPTANPSNTTILSPKE
jgi:cyclophilin family peptidyl-prolyl cis-trans isomerase